MNNINDLIKYRKEVFNETYEYVTLKNGKMAIMFFPVEIDFSINITIFIKNEYCRLLATFDDEDKKIIIGDIQVLQNKLMNIGIGTILLKKLIEIARKVKAKEITGFMSYNSEEQKERQIAFYTKNGFNIDQKGNLSYEICY